MVIAATVEDFEVQKLVFTLILFDYMAEVYDSGTIEYLETLFSSIGFDDFSDLYTINLARKEMVNQQMRYIFMHSNNSVRTINDSIPQELRKILGKFNRGRKVYSAIAETIFINNFEMSPNTVSIRSIS